MLRVGLTGGIACGKSHVLRRLAERGCRTLDLDAVARAVTAPGSEALGEIRAAFGGRVFDAKGALDRPALGALVFGDAAARERLNRIVHPRVRAAEAGWAAGFAGAPAAVLVTDGALLIESGAHLRFDRLVAVHCAPELQLRRLRQRDGLDEAAARARIEAQLPSAAKRAFAHFDVDTSGTLEDATLAADALAERLAALARRERTPPADCVFDRFAAGLAHGPGAGPRGLSGSALLAEAAAAGGLEMDALARRLSPPCAGPWYRAAAEGTQAGAPATRLGVAVAAWSCARAGDDPDFAAAAAGSVARLTHSDPIERAEACLVALAALARATSADGGPQPPALALALAARFGGAAPGARVGALWSALAQAPADPEEAAAICAGLGGDAPTAAALAGLRADVSADSVEPWRRALREIRSVA